MPRPNPVEEKTAMARNAASNYLFRGLTALSVLLLTPYLFRKLGVGGFGTWSVMFTVATVFSLLEWGFSNGVTKYVAEYRARSDQSALDRTVGAAVVIMGGLGVVALAFSLAMAFFASGLAADSERDAYQLGLVILGLSMLVRFPCMAYGAALFGYQRLDLMNGAQLVSVVLFPIAAVVTVEAGGGVLGVSVAYAASLVLGGLVFGVLLRREAPGLSLRPRWTTRATRRRILGFSSYSLLIDSMTFLATRLDTVVIAAIRSAAAAAPFAAAVRLQGGLQSIVTPFMDLLMPMASDLKARGLYGVIAKRFVLTTRAALQITLPMAFLLVLFATDITRLWLGAEAPEVTAPIIALLATVQIFALSTVPAQKILTGLGRVRALGGLAVVEGLTNLGLSIALVSTMGALGAAFGTLFTTALLAPVKWPIACREIGISVWHLLRRGVAPALAASLPAIAAMAVVYLLLEPGGVRLAAGAGLGIGLALLVAVIQAGPRRTIDQVNELRGVGRRGSNATPDPQFAGDPR